MLGRPREGAPLPIIMPPKQNMVFYLCVIRSLNCPQVSAVTICTVLFLAVAVGSYATFGPGVPADVLENFTSR